MRQGEFVWDESMTWQSRVIINGAVMANVSWDLSRGMTNIPGMSNTSTNGAVGTVVIAPDADDPNNYVDANYPIPWRREGAWPPLKGDPIEIDVRSIDTTNWEDQFTGEWFRRFTGTVDNAEWDSDGNYRVEVVDRIDRFSRPMSKEPVLQDMPPQPRYEGTDKRFVDLQMATYIEEAMSVAGFDACVPRQKWEAIRIPMCGSLWPTKGQITTGTVNNPPWGSRAEVSGWGYGMKDFWLWCVGDWSEFAEEMVDELGQQEGGVAALTGKSDKTIYLRIPEENAGEWRFEVFTYQGGSGGGASGTGYNVVVHADNSVTVKATPDGTVQDSVDIPANEHSGVLCMTYRCAEGRILIDTYTPGDEFGDDFHSYSINVMADEPYTSVGYTTLDTNAVVGGCSVSFWNLRDQGLQDGQLLPDGQKFDHWKPTATIPYANDNLSGMTAGRQIVGEKCSEVLDQVGQAGVCHWGLDEDGLATVIPVLQRVKKTPVLNLVDDTDIYDKISWSSALQLSACQIKENLLIPQVDSREYASVQVYQGDKQGIDSWQTVDQTITIPDNEDWIFVDGTYGSSWWARRMYWDDSNPSIPGNNNVFYAGASRSDANVKRMNKGRGSVFMATHTGYANGAEINEIASNSEYDVWIGWNDDNRSIHIRQSAPAAGVDITTVGPKDASWLNGWLRNAGMPVLRAMGKVEWLKGWTTSKDNGSDAPVFEHDVGWWAGDNGHRTQEQLLELMTEGLVKLGELSIRPDPRIQMGDPVSVNLTMINLTVNGCLSSVHESFDDNGYSQSVGILVGSHEVTDASWSDFQRVWGYHVGTDDWRAMQELWKTLDWEAFQQAPLQTSM